MFDGHLVCAMDIETTGDHFEKHDIWQFTCVPLDYNYEVCRDIKFLDILIKPSRPENIDWSVMARIKQSTKVRKAIAEGIDADLAAEYIWEWFDSLKLASYKRIIPLASNWAGLDKLFIQMLVGKENFNFMFDSRVRDVMTAAAFLNDRAVFNNLKPPFKDLKLKSICEVLNVSTQGLTLHNSFDDAILAARAYKELCRM